MKAFIGSTVRFREGPSETDIKLIPAADIRVLKRLDRRNGP